MASTFFLCSGLYIVPLLLGVGMCGVNDHFPVKLQYDSKTVYARGSIKPTQWTANEDGTIVCNNKANVEVDLRLCQEFAVEQGNPVSIGVDSKQTGHDFAVGMERGAENTLSICTTHPLGQSTPLAEVITKADALNPEDWTTFNIHEIYSAVLDSNDDISVITCKVSE